MNHQEPIAIDLQGAPLSLPSLVRIAVALETSGAVTVRNARSMPEGVTPLSDWLGQVLRKAKEGRIPA